MTKYSVVGSKEPLLLYWMIWNSRGGKGRVKWMIGLVIRRSDCLQKWSPIHQCFQTYNFYMNLFPQTQSLRLSGILTYLVQNYIECRALSLSPICLDLPRVAQTSQLPIALFVKIVWGPRAGIIQIYCVRIVSFLFCLPVACLFRVCLNMFFMFVDFCMCFCVFLYL